MIRRCASVSDTGVTGVCNWGVQVSSFKNKMAAIFFLVKYTFLPLFPVLQENGVYWEECYCSHDSCNSAMREQAAFLIPLITTLLLRLLL